RTPVKVAFIALFFNIVLNLLFIRPLRNGGPALATSFSAFFNSITLFLIFCRRHGSFGVREIARSVAKFIGGSIALGVVAYVVVHWPGFYSGHLTQKVIALGVTIAVSTATYFAAARLLHFRELAELRAVRGAKPVVNQSV